MVNPAVFEATGVDAEEWTGFAFGFGIDRIAIMRHGISDLRSFIENDLRFLRQF
jgi:phenylalanyl-tRNA synthetase alpha chain